VGRPAERSSGVYKQLKCRPMTFPSV
jgi:hypothetical protein